MVSLLMTTRYIYLQLLLLDTQSTMQSWLYVSQVQKVT